MLDLESEAIKGLGSIPTGGNILSLDFFWHSKASDANIGIITNFVYLWKTRLLSVTSILIQGTIANPQHLFNLQPFPIISIRSEVVKSQITL